MSNLLDHKQVLINTSINTRILYFGTFTLKSGRISPYFFQAGAFNTASLLSTLSNSYAATIALQPDLCPANSPPNFDVIFGPAYKGIPLASVTATALYALSPGLFGNVGYAFNRKEKKDHGEGGSIVGADLKGKRVLIVDDVITAGTAIREAVGIIESAGGKVVGIVVVLDRQERLVGNDPEGLSAVQSVRKELAVPVVSILTLEDLIEGVSGEERKHMMEYRNKYGAKNENDTITGLR
jgi:orotate phosphoribosyltransferase